MLFFEKQNDRYVFKNFAVTQQIEDGQIPEIIQNYIQEEIMKKQTDIAAIIYKGINAVKNAYDRSFQQKLIERVPNMLLCRYYYKGYSCISTHSYYFKDGLLGLQRDVFYLYSGKYNMFEEIENNPDNFLQEVGRGAWNCGITLGISFALRHLRNTDGVQKLIQALQNENSWNTLAANLLKIMDTEFYNEFMHKLTEEGIKNTSEIIWAE
jgi:hypothetical protein